MFHPVKELLIRGDSKHVISRWKLYPNYNKNIDSLWDPQWVNFRLKRNKYMFRYWANTVTRYLDLDLYFFRKYLSHFNDVRCLGLINKMFNYLYSEITRTQVRSKFTKQCPRILRNSGSLFVSGTFDIFSHHISSF